MTAYFIRPFLDLLSLGGLKVMPVSTGSSSLYTLKSFLIAQASPFSDSVSNFLNCLLSFRDYSSKQDDAGTVGNQQVADLPAYGSFIFKDICDIQLIILLLAFL